MNEIYTQPCKSCGKPIAFVRNPRTGNWQPYDPQPIVAQADDPHQTIIKSDGNVQRGVKRGDAGFVPHWFTCDDPERFRRK